jgi:restriction endonuclease S subunit
VLASFAKGVNILHLSNSDLRRLTLPLPPLDEQKRIVEEISKIETKIHESVQHIKILEKSIEDCVLKVWK